MSEISYVPMIDSIIDTHESPENLTSKLIVNQLQSVLNLNFTAEQKHNLKKLAKIRISRSQTQKKTEEENKRIAIENQLKCFIDLIIDKIRSQVWKDLLYVQNQTREHSTDNLMDTPPNVPTDIPIDGMTNTTSDVTLPISENVNNHMSALYRKNITLISQLNSSLNPFDLIPTTKNFIKCRQLQAKRKRTKTFYNNYQDTLKVRSSIDSKKLFSWSQDIQNLLNIKDPLTTQEVLYLTHRYLKEHKLLVNSAFHPDDKTSFLGPATAKLPMNKLFKILETHSQSVVGTLYPDNSRILHKYPDTSIPTNNYNITQQLWDNETAKFLQDVDVLKEFHTLYKTYIRKTIKRKKNA